MRSTRILVWPVLPQKGPHHCRVQSIHEPSFGIHGGLKVADEAPASLTSEELDLLWLGSASPISGLLGVEPVVLPAAVPGGDGNEAITSVAPAFARGYGGLFHLGGYLHSRLKVSSLDISNMDAR